MKAQMNCSQKASYPKPNSSKDRRESALASASERMGKLFTPNQVLGRIHAIGCVAVEITQKCNLDCTLCYLSEHSQSVKDIPIQEIYRRLDQVFEHYGKGTHVQITGGDPTLRKHTELIEIVRYARDLGLYPALFTNGIAASRELLTKLAEVGLCDVAFHVDTTQRRKESDTEISLNDIRKEYIQRASGLGLHVMFNTTVHRGNFDELPKLVKFFRANASEVGLVSFQLQAETGRGEWGSRDFVINQSTVRNQIDSGSSKTLPWDAIQVGHTDCHSYLPTLVTNDNIYPLVYTKEFFSKFIEDFKTIRWDRLEKRSVILKQFLCVLLKRPRWWIRGIAYLYMQFKQMGADIFRAKGNVHPLTFFIQNFMDANDLNEERVHACSFMVMTAQGPVSMCEHNANRDDYILQPLLFKNADGKTESYEPLAGKEKQAVISPS